MGKINYSKTSFVTVNVVKDWINDLRDLVGLKQKTYAKVVNEEVNKIIRDMEKKGEIIWFRQVVDRTFGRSIQITIYGQIEVK